VWHFIGVYGRFLWLYGVISGGLALYRAYGGYIGLYTSYIGLYGGSHRGIWGSFRGFHHFIGLSRAI